MSSWSLSLASKKPRLRLEASHSCVFRVPRPRSHKKGSFEGIARGPQRFCEGLDLFFWFSDLFGRGLDQLPILCPRLLSHICSALYNTTGPPNPIPLIKASLCSSLYEFMHFYWLLDRANKFPKP